MHSLFTTYMISSLKYGQHPIIGPTYLQLESIPLTQHIKIRLVSKLLSKSYYKAFVGADKSNEDTLTL